MGGNGGMGANGSMGGNGGIAGCVNVVRDIVGYFGKLIAFDFDLMRKEDTDVVAKAIILAAIRSLP